MNMPQPRIIIVGAGFGGLAAKALKNTPAEIAEVAAHASEKAI
jgi:NADH dehydrogenase FAD-containing subunit